MSLFTPYPKKSPPPAPVSGGQRHGSMRGDRVVRLRHDPDPEPSHRQKGVTLEGNAKKGARAGLTNAVVLDRQPRGCAFKVGGLGGWFDLDGYWCVPGFDGAVTVRRGSPKAILKLMTPPQKKELARIRLQARRHGLR
jgi:hypothetical protein